MTDIITTIPAERVYTQLQIASASKMAQGLALADAVQKRGDLFAATDDFLRALRALKDCGADRNFLWDCAAGAIDAVRNVAHAIDKGLDEQGLVECEPLDLSELHAFLESVK